MEFNPARLKFQDLFHDKMRKFETTQIMNNGYTEILLQMETL